MDCAEVFFKLVEIPIAFTAAGATVAAVFFARRAYMAQAKQLRDLEEDRMFAGLTSAPRFIAETTPQVWDQRFPEPTLLIPKLYTKPWSGPSIDRPPGKKDPVWFKIRNIREGVTLRKIHVVQEDGRPSPIEFYWVGHDTYLVSYSEDLAARSERLSMKIYFETTDGVEGVHTYETICGTLDFRRVNPPSIIDNAGIKFARDSGDQEQS